MNTYDVYELIQQIIEWTVITDEFLFAFDCVVCI